MQEIFFVIQAKSHKKEKGGTGEKQCLLDVAGLLYCQAHGTYIAYIRPTLDKGSQYSCMELHICICVCECMYMNIYMHIKKKMNLGDD